MTSHHTASVSFVGTLQCFVHSRLWVTRTPNSCIPIIIRSIISAEIRCTYPSFRSSSRPWIGIPAGANLLGWSGILQILLPNFTFDLESNDHQSWPLIRPVGNPPQPVHSLGTICDLTSIAPRVRRDPGGLGKFWVRNMILQSKNNQLHPRGKIRYN